MGESHYVVIITIAKHFYTTSHVLVVQTKTSVYLLYIDVGGVKAR